MSFCKCKLTLLTQNIAHAELKCEQNIEKNTGRSITLLYSSLEPYFCQSFIFIVLGYKFCYQWIPIPVQKSSQASTGTRSRWRLETAQKRERHLDVLPLRDFGTKERESKGREVVLGTLLKLLVKDKLLHCGKVPMNAELRPEERETRNGNSAYSRR